MTLFKSVHCRARGLLLAFWLVCSVGVYMCVLFEVHVSLVMVYQHERLSMLVHLAC